MNDQIRIDFDELFREVVRYLAAVETFRGVGCEPTWLPEPVLPAAKPTTAIALAEQPPSAYWTTR